MTLMVCFGVTELNSFVFFANKTPFKRRPQSLKTSVTNHISATKMIFKIFFALCALLLLSEIHAETYSAVNVQSNSKVLPYYPPSTFAVPSYARLTAPAPVLQTKVPAQLPPCIPPCIPLADYLTQVVPLASPLNVNTIRKVFPVYGPPAESRKAKISEEDKLPQAKEDNSYQYSYLVYDENTGDRKAQQEASDGSKVQGQYSLIQPDGYIREVQYTADDLTGFNAVVKNFLPDTSDIGVAAPSGVFNEARAKLKNIKVPEPSQRSELEEPGENNKEINYEGKVEPLVKNSEEKKESKEDIDDGPRKIILSYEDIIRCANLIYGANIKDDVKEDYAVTNKPKSALTYIILPSFGLGKPC